MHDGRELRTAVPSRSDTIGGPAEGGMTKLRYDK